MQLFSSWTGSDFLIVYVVLLGVCCAAAWWIPWHFRDPGRRGEATDIESAALLAGGRSRLLDAVLADLYVRGGLAPSGDGRLIVARRDLPLTGAGKALQALDGPITIRDARRSLGRSADRVAARLRRSGLLMWPDDHMRLRWLSIAPFAVPLVLGLYRQRAVSATGEQTDLLVVLLVVTAVLAIVRFWQIDPRTKAGVAALNDLRTRGASALSPQEAAMAVAFSGTAVLVGTPWEPLHAMRRSSDAGGSGGDAGGSDSCDGGDGGGGCGD